MAIGKRVKRIRELRRMSNKAIATKMNITAQTYRKIEETDNLKYSTIKRFCDATDVDPSFLLAEDVPLNEETVQFFDKMKGKPFLLCYEQLRQKAEVYGEVLNLHHLI